MNDKVSPVKRSSKAYYRVPVSWRAQATWPTQDLVKHVKRTVAATSQSTQLPLSSSSPGCSDRRSPNCCIPFRIWAQLLWFILTTLGSIVHCSRLPTNLHAIHDLTKDAGASGSMKQSQQLTHFLFLHGVRMKLRVKKSKFTHTQALLRRNVHSRSRDSSCLPASKHFLHSRSDLPKTVPQPASFSSSARLAVRRQ